MRDPQWVRATRFLVLFILTVFTVVPLYVMVVSSVKPLADVQGLFTFWPSVITFQPFVEMWQTVPLAQYFTNSLWISIEASVLSVLIAIVAAYALSRFRFRGRTGFMSVVLSTQMFPGILFLLP